MEAWRKSLEIVADSRPSVCPWRAFYNRTVIDVLEAVRACSGGMGITPAMLIEMDPPHHVWLGVHEYVNARNNIQDHDRKLEEKNAKKNGR